MKKKTITMYNDPGHGWAKVAKKELMDLGISSEITSYSYMRGDFAYLEEDCDLSHYIKALKGKYGEGIEIKFNDNYGEKRSKIRSYQSYQA